MHLRDGARRLGQAAVHGLRAAFEAIFGQVSWRAPRWLPAAAGALRAARLRVQADPRRYATAAAALVLLAAGGWFGYQWWQALPRPPEPVAVRVRVKPPRPTDYAKDPLAIHPLRAKFSASAARIEQVGKDVAAGIRIEPEIAGTWTWHSDRELRFQPQDEWPVGQRFEVRFDKAKLFAPQVRVIDAGFEFRSPAFVAEIAGSEFYQDPQDAALKKAIVEVKFSHPVDPLAFEKRVAMRLIEPQGKPRPRKFVVNYDARKLTAYVHSEPLALPEDAATLALEIDKGVRATRGGTPSAEALRSEVAIPGRYGLSITGVNATLVDNTRFEPEQVLVVATSQTVGETEASQAVKAWLLPTWNPDRPGRARGYDYYWSVREISDKVLAAAQPLDLEPVPTELDYSPVHSYKYRADPGRFVYVQVEKGLKSFGGYLLGKRSMTVLRVLDYPRMLRFMGEGALMSLSGERRVAIVARNVPGLRLEVARIQPEQLHHLAGLNYGGYAHPQLGQIMADKIMADQIGDRFEQTLAFANDEPGKAHYEGIDLAPYLDRPDLDGPDRRGVFLLTLREYDPEAEAKARQAEDAQAAHLQGLVAPGELPYDARGDSDDPHNYVPPGSDSRLVVLTDLGLLLKTSFDRSLDVFVQSIRSGEPVEAATVEVIGRNGQRLLGVPTGRDGHVHIAALDGFERERTPAMLRVRKGEDVSFLPLAGRDRRLEYSRFDVGGVRNARVTGQLGAYLFSDRGLYRPGETFHVGMIVRADDWSRSLAGLPLQAEVFDPRGLRVDRRPLRLGETGFEELSYATQESAPTGAWTVNLSLVRDDGRIYPLGSTSVQVKEFLPDRMKASAHFSREAADGWVKPDDLRARVSLQNLFGTPAQDRRVEATLTLTPALPAFRGYPDFRFHDPQRAKEGYSEPLGERRTDAAGEAEFPLGLGKYGRATYRLQFVARGFEAEGGRGVAAEASTLVSSLDYLVGVKTDGELGFVEREAARNVRLIAIDPDAKLLAVEGLKAVRVERRYLSILTKQDSGVYKYESRLKEVPVAEAPLTIPAAGIDYPLDTGTPGDFALLVKNARGEELNRIEYSVAGAANLGRSLDRNAELQLALSKRDYAPGEDIEVSIRAPYAGLGLITIEREKVYAHAWFKADTSASVQTIRVPDGFEGNGYLNVQFVRDPASDEIFMSPLSYGVVPFSVDRQARRNALAVDVPERVKPGEKLALRVRSAKPGRVAVFAVDEGILQVARYRLGDPLDHFFKKRMLEVRTSQILDLILPEFSQLLASAAPGGDAEGLLGLHLNPFRSKRAPAVAYWSGLLDLEGERELEYAVPDYFNGRLRVMAVAVSREGIGVFEGATTVRGDFVLSPNVPAVVAPGDEFEVSVGVANNVAGLDGKTLPVEVTVAPSPQLEIVGKDRQTLSLGEMREGAAVFRLRARGEPGAAHLVFSAGSGARAARLGADLSVRPAVPYRTRLTLGHLGRGEAEVAPLRAMFEPFAKREAAASHTPLVMAGGLASFLAYFPYFCTEQLLSQAVPALVSVRNPEFGMRVLGNDRLTPRERFADLLAVLRSRQNAEGGFGYWVAEVQAGRYVSAYAMQFLIEAGERGWAVPADMLARGNGYLLQLAADEADTSLDGLRERAFAIYLLTRQQQVTTNHLAAVRQRLDTLYGEGWREDSVAAYLAASLKLLKEDREAERLIAGPERVLSRSAVEAAWEHRRFHDPLVRDASVLYLIARHFPERAARLPAQALENIVQALRKGHYNTLSSAMTVLALDAYGQQGEGIGAEDLSISQVDDGGAATPISQVQGRVARGAFGAAVRALRVNNAGERPAWYSVSESGYDTALPDREIKDGLEVSRDYTDASGRAVDTVGLGEELLVRVKIRATGRQPWENVAIVDLLPGGFEPVLEIPVDSQAPGAPATAWRPAIGLPQSTWKPDYADVREDRVVIYGTATTDVRQFVYRIRATNAGRFVTPPLYAESMYDRSVQAQSRGGRIVVERR